MNLLKGGAIAVLVLVLAVLVGVGRPEGARGGSSDNADGITVTGTGEVKTVPDRAGFTFGVETHRKNASGALDENSRQTRALVAALRDAGIPDRDIQTTSVSLWPDYDDSGSEKVGYVASNSVSVRVAVRDAGSVVDAAAGAGVDQIDGPNVAQEDSDALRRAALREAVADARERAKALAAAAGVELGAVTSIEEQIDGGGGIYADTAMAAPRASVPIEPGTQRVEASVSVTFAIA
jgi:uncharacterized protein YggE